MSFSDLTRDEQTAYQTLVDCGNRPFTPTVRVRPVVDVIVGRRTNDDLAGREWLDALEASEVDVAIYLRLTADHEWWLGYDDGWDGDRGEYGLEGPFVQWSTYPSGPWSLQRHSGALLSHAIDDIVGHTYNIYRSRVVRVEDAPEFVRYELE